jgi:hypothetical protein
MDHARQYITKLPEMAKGLSELNSKKMQLFQTIKGELCVFNIIISLYMVISLFLYDNTTVVYSQSKH